MNNLAKILLLVGILAILGINILKYLARGAKKAVAVAKNVSEDITQNIQVTKENTGNLQRAIDNNEKKERVVPSKSDDTVQHRKAGGWCYVGEDRGFRSCIEISDSDKCMSGDIFPTRQICINPSLRV